MFVERHLPLVHSTPPCSACSSLRLSQPRPLPSLLPPSSQLLVSNSPLLSPPPTLSRNRFRLCLFVISCREPLLSWSLWIFMYLWLSAWMHEDRDVKYHFNRIECKAGVLSHVAYDHVLILVLRCLRVVALQTLVEFGRSSHLKSRILSSRDLRSNMFLYRPCWQCWHQHAALW